YVSFGYELTKHLKFGADNVIAVRADTSQQPASRWYTGGGIYRHVRLVVKDAVHIPQWGTFVSTPQVNDKEALVRVAAEVANSSNSPQKVSLQVTLLAPDGKVSQTATTKITTVALGAVITLQQELAIRNPIWWELDRPVLYRAIARVQVAGKE